MKVGTCDFCVFWTNNIDFLGFYDINVDVAFMRTHVWLMNLCFSEGKDGEVNWVKIILIICSSIIPDTAFLTLRQEKPAADSCGDPFQEKWSDDLLTVGCGAEVLKEMMLHGSGDDIYDDTDHVQPVATTTVIPSRTLLSTAEHHPTTLPTKTTGLSIISVAPSRSASRLPPRVTSSPDIRHSSFQRLLRSHLNNFNLRLSMLESNTLDMKAGIRTVEEKQSRLSSQLKELIATQSAGEKKKRISKLETSYTGVDVRLTRLEDRLEILIDGFTALAQELNKIKRSRHIFRSPQERKVLPSLPTVLAIPSYSTPRTASPVTPRETPLISKATVPRSIPAPRLPANKPTAAPQRDKSAATSTPEKNSSKPTSITKSHISTKMTLSKPRTGSKIKSKTAMKPGGRRSPVTTKLVSQPNQTKPGEVKEEITKFQLEPPSHKSKPARTHQQQPDNARQSQSAPPIKNTGSKKPFSSDTVVMKKVHKGGKSTEGNWKKSSEPQREGFNQNEKMFPKKKLTTLTTKQRPAEKSKAAGIAAKSTAGSAKNVAKIKQQKKETNTHSGLLDLLGLLKGDLTANRKKTKDRYLHVVLGRLAIPVQIIPDD